MGATAPRPCPVCGKGLSAGAKTTPFCSPRRQWVDLGRWPDGHYALPGDAVPGEDAVGLDAIIEYEMRKGQEERADTGD